MQLKAALRGHDYATQVQMLAPDGDGGPRGSVHAAAAQGLSGAGGSLPHAAQIQKSFGGYDISNVQTHADAAATKANAAMGSAAYATGNHVVLGPAGQDLHTVAHEAAHVVQQRSGVSLSGGVGQAGDPYERHADAVADRVVQGKSAEDLLGQMGGGTGGHGVQMQDDPDARGKKDAVANDEETGADDGILICSMRTDEKGSLLIGLQGSAPSFSGAARSSLLKFEAAAKLQKNRDEGKARIGAALENANRAARAKALVEAAIGLPDLLNTLNNIQTVRSATAALRARTTESAALMTVTGPGFGSRMAKELGDSYKAGANGLDAAGGGDADATIASVGVVGDVAVKHLQANASEAESEAHSLLKTAMDFQVEMVDNLEKLLCLGVDNLNAEQRATLDRVVGYMNEGFAALRELPLLKAAVELEAGSAMAAGTPSRGLIDLVSEDKMLQKGLRVVRTLNREFVVGEGDEPKEKPVVTQGYLKAITDDARLAVQGFGFWTLSSAWGGWVSELPEATVTVLGLIVATEELESPTIVVRSEGAFPVSVKVSRKEWLSDRAAVMNRVRANRAGVDAYEKQEFLRKVR